METPVSHQNVICCRLCIVLHPYAYVYCRLCLMYFCYNCFEKHLSDIPKIKKEKKIYKHARSIVPFKLREYYFKRSKNSTKIRKSRPEQCCIPICAAYDIEDNTERLLRMLVSTPESKSCYEKFLCLKKWNPKNIVLYIYLISVLLFNTYIWIMTQTSPGKHSPGKYSYRVSHTTKESVNCDIIAIGAID